MSLEDLRKEALKLGRSDAETLTKTALKIFIKTSKKASSICKTTLKSDLLKIAESASVNPIKSNGKPKTKYELCIELEEKNSLINEQIKPKSRQKKTDIEKSIQTTLEEEYKVKLDKLDSLMKSLEVEKELIATKEQSLKDRESSLEQDRRKLNESLTSKLEEELRERDKSFVKVLQQKDIVIETLKKQNELDLKQNNEQLEKDVNRLKETEETLLKQAELIKDAEDSRVKREEALRKQTKHQETEAEKTKEKYLLGLEKLKEKEKTTKAVLLEQLKKDRKKVGKLTDDEVKVKLYENSYFESMFKDAIAYLLETTDSKIHRSITIKEIIQTVPQQRFIDYAKKQFNIQTTKTNSKEDILDKMLQVMVETADISTNFSDNDKPADDDDELNADLAVFNVEKNKDDEGKSFEMKQHILNWPVRQLDVNSVDKLLTELQSSRTTTTDLVKVQKIVFNALGLIN